MNPLTGPESRQNLLWLSVSLGFLAGANGSDTTPAIQFIPQPHYTLP
jgi:hypothetical protein